MLIDIYLWKEIFKQVTLKLWFSISNLKSIIIIPNCTFNNFIIFIVLFSVLWFWLFFSLRTLILLLSPVTNKSKKDLSRPRKGCPKTQRRGRPPKPRDWPGVLVVHRSTYKMKINRTCMYTEYKFIHTSSSGNGWRYQLVLYNFKS